MNNTLIQRHCQIQIIKKNGSRLLAGTGKNKWKTYLAAFLARHLAHLQPAGHFMAFLHFFTPFEHAALAFGQAALAFEHLAAFLALHAAVLPPQHFLAFRLFEHLALALLHDDFLPMEQHPPIKTTATSINRNFFISLLLIRVMVYVTLQT